MKILEKHIENRLRKKITALGCLCEKFTSPQRRSVPDRIISAKGGMIWFVECKAPGKKPTPAQKRDHLRRRELGFDIRVIDTYEKVDLFVKEIKAAMFVDFLS